jgi:hypothetical protein
MDFYDEILVNIQFCKMNLLTIMIPTLESRVDKLTKLIIELNNKKELLDNGDQIFIDVLSNYQSASIGFRRNILLQRANSKYVCFFDDDDMPTEFYLKRIVEGMVQDYDCCSMKGIYTVNGQNPEVFEHSLKYSSWRTNEGVEYPNVKYERTPNHLNCIKTEIAKQFTFKNVSHGEDNDWSDDINNSKKIKTEFYIEEPIYKYLKII